MKHTLVIITILFLSITSFAQQCYSPNMNTGKAEYENENYEKAISYFETAKSCPDKPGNSDANSWIEKCNLKKKEECFNEYYDKAISYFNKKNYEDAKVYFSKAKSCGASHLNYKAENYEEKIPLKIAPNGKLYSKKYIILSGDNNCTNSISGYRGPLYNVDFKNGLIAVYNYDKNKIGFMNEDGYLSIPFEYDCVEEFNNDICFVGFFEPYPSNPSKKYGVINTSGEKLVDFKYKKIDYYELPGYLITYCGKYSLSHCDKGLLKMNGDEVLECNYNSLSIVQSKNKKFIKYSDHGDAGLLDMEDNKILSSMYDYIKVDEKSDLIVVTDNQKKGLANESGEIVIPVIYDNISPAYSSPGGRPLLYEDNIFLVKINGGPNFLDDQYGLYSISKGAEISSKKYNYIDEVDENYDLLMVIIRINNNYKKKYGYINTNGKEVIPCIYDEDFYFEDGKAKVKKGISSYYIDTNGNKVK